MFLICTILNDQFEFNINKTPIEMDVQYSAALYGHLTSNVRFQKKTRSNLLLLHFLVHIKTITCYFVHWNVSTEPSIMLEFVKYRRRHDFL